MLRLVGLGVLASFFFSSTFIINKIIANDGGHWAWSAILRYIYALIMLSGLIGLRRGSSRLIELWRIFFAHAQFWIIAGSIGYGVFYAALCYSAPYAPDWVTATTWQTTILMTIVVLKLFGNVVKRSCIVCSAVVFLGVILVNLPDDASSQSIDLLKSVAPILLGAFAYCFGHQMLKEATNGTALDGRGLEQNLLMTIGSLPFWLALWALIQPPAPSHTQTLQTLFVAILSGVIATSLYLTARSMVKGGNGTAAIDATQSGESVFTLLIGVGIGYTAMPSVLHFFGLVLVVLGVALYAFAVESKPHWSS